MHHPQQFHAFNPNFKDTRWLTLEVCREFQRAKCQRTDAECKFAHPPPHVEVTNGKVIACYDSLKVFFQDYIIGLSVFKIPIYYGFLTRYKLI